MKPVSFSGVPVTVWKGDSHPAMRQVPAEVPVALVFDGGTEAVMMASPADLEDFGVGFSLNERIIASRDEITAIEVVETPGGMEVRMALVPGPRGLLVHRRRVRAGPVGCGLCGVESLAAALPPLPLVTGGNRFPATAIVTALRDMRPLQAVNAVTHGVHAAALLVHGAGIVALREDIGRHNALDKLAGALARSGRQSAGEAVLVTSRLSVELVQKVAVMGAGVIAAISVPTTLALEQAERAGITVVAVVRDDGLEVFTHPDRIETDGR